MQSGSTTPTKTPVDSSTLASITESPSTTATLTAAAAAAQTLNTPQRSISTTPSASPVVASPLPPVPKAKTLSSTKSANWVARLHAQPSNAAVQSVRRYTNDEAQPGVHASLDVPFMAGSSARGSLDGDGAVPGVDLLGLDDQAVQDQWQQPETLPQGLNQTSDQGIWDDNAQHSAAGELKPIAQHVTQVADQHWVGIAEQQDASELPLQIWPDDAQLLHSVQAADTRHSGRAEPSSLRQSVCKAAVQPVQDGQLMDPFSQFQASPSVSSLQAEPSMLSTSTDHHPTEVWHSAAASMMSSSTDNILQQLDDWHDADEFGNFESGAASNTHVVTEVLHQPQTAQEQSVLLQNAAVNSCMQEGCSLRQPSSDLEAWGSFTFPDSAVPLQLLSHDDTLHPESSLSASEGRDALRQSQGMLHMEPQHSSSNLQGHISIVEHLDAKQQKQLELFMSSADLSEISS